MADRTTLKPEEGFTLIELLMAVAIIGIVAGVAVPGVLRARQASSEASAIAAVRVVSSGQTAFASSCGGGGYASVIGALEGFVTPDVSDAIAAPGKSGYLIHLNEPAAPPDADTILVGAVTCNAVADSMTNYVVTATPVSVGMTGRRSFAAEANATIFQDSTGAVITAPIAAGGTISLLGAD